MREPQWRYVCNRPRRRTSTPPAPSRGPRVRRHSPPGEQATVPSPRPRTRHRRTARATPAGPPQLLAEVGVQVLQGLSPRAPRLTTGLQLGYGRLVATGARYPVIGWSAQHQAPSPATPGPAPRLPTGITASHNVPERAGQLAIPGPPTARRKSQESCSARAGQIVPRAASLGHAPDALPTHLCSKHQDAPECPVS